MGTLYNETTTPKRRLYTYVYDCGSDQIHALRREVNSAHLHFGVDEPKQIETVFISHLDADHVNGFDTLCESFDRQIGRVVLPYLDLESRYYLAAGAMADNSATGLFLEFVADPVKWIKTRLPNAQIDLLGPQPGDAPDAPPPPAPDTPVEGSQTGRVFANADNRPEPLIERSVGFNSGYPHIMQYRWISIRIPAPGVTDSPILLLAHVPPRSSAKLTAFRTALTAAGFGKMSAARLRAILANAQQREALRTCFLELASDHNIISIHLLVKAIGKARLDDESKGRFRHIPWRWPAIKDGMGFLFSGDAKLSTKKYFDHWKEFYLRHLDDVRLFSLPHHGSKLSFQTPLLNALPNANFIAQAGKNGHGHPSKEIVQQINGAGRAFHQVNGDVQERIDIVYQIS